MVHGPFFLCFSFQESMVHGPFSSVFLSKKAWCTHFLQFGTVCHNHSVIEFVFLVSTNSGKILPCVQSGGGSASRVVKYLL